MKPRLGDSVQFWAERLTDAQAAWALRAVIAIANGGAPAKPPPPDMPREAVDDILEEHSLMRRYYEAKVERLRQNGRLGGEARARVILAEAGSESAREAKSPRSPEVVANATISSREQGKQAIAKPGDEAPAALPPETWGSVPDEIGDYGVIFDLHHDATLLAAKIAGERPTALRLATYTKLLRALGEVRFRSVLATFWGERRAGELATLDNPGAYLVSRLQAFMPGKS